jgi:uncharacterized membrane protein
MAGTFRMQADAPERQAALRRSAISWHSSGMIAALRTRLSDTWARTRNSYLLIPALMLAASVGIALGMIYLDVRLHESELRLPWLTTLTVGASRTILATLAGSTATIAGVVFSITIVALQLGASQFGPHVMRAFLNDRGSQFVLGTFIGTFAYALIVMATGRADANFVPYVATVAAIALGIVTMAVLIYFINHIAEVMRLESVLRRLGRHLVEAIDTHFPDRLGRGETVTREQPSVMPPCLRELGVKVAAKESGYVRRINERALIRLATRHGLLVWLEARPGDFVVSGMVLMVAAPLGPARLDSAAIKALRGTVVLGERRTPEQDIPYALQQLVEVAVRALSPGINAPFVALPAIDGLAAGLARLAERRMPSLRRLDGSGTERVLVARGLTLAEMARDALGPIASAGATHCFVIARVAEVAFLVAASARGAEDREELRAFAEAIADEGEAALGSERERDVVRRRRVAARTRPADAVR